MTEDSLVADAAPAARAIDRSGPPLLQIRHLVKHFPIRRGAFGRVQAHVRAVDGVSFDLWRGETLGLVGG